MTNIEQKALELVHEVVQERSESPWIANREADAMFEAFCRAIERHEAFRQEVSDAVRQYERHCSHTCWPFPADFARFIIAKPDPLVEAVKDILDDDSLDNAEEFSEAIRAALAKRGLEIREKE